MNNIQNNTGIMIQLLSQRIMAVCLPVHVPVLGAFVKLRKGIIRFVVSVYPSVRLYGTTRLTGRIFMKFDI